MLMLKENEKEISKQNSRKRMALEFSIFFSSSLGECGQYGTRMLELSKGSQVAL